MSMSSTVPCTVSLLQHSTLLVHYAAALILEYRDQHLRKDRAKVLELVVSEGISVIGGLQMFELTVHWSL